MVPRIACENVLQERRWRPDARTAQSPIVDLELGRVEPHLKTMRRLAAALGAEPLEIDEFQKAIEEKAAA